jgi:hypothetical protein
MAQSHSTVLSSETREEVESFLSTCHSRNLFLSTAIVDALVAFGMVQSPVGSDDVARDLAAILGAYEDPVMQELAYRTVSNVFEDVYQGLLGRDQ